MDFNKIYRRACEVNMNFTEQFNRLYPLFMEELPHVFKLVSYSMQLAFCIVAIIAVAIWNLLLRAGNEVEKMQKANKPQRFTCAFDKRVSCTALCKSWVRTMDGSGYCKKLREKK